MDAEKTIQFLLDQQAGHDERLAKLETNVTRLATIAEMQIEAHDRLTKETNAQIRALAEGQDQKMADLRDKVNSVTENMNALIRVVDGMIRRPPA
jgi:hypothetical protein